MFAIIDSNDSRRMQFRNIEAFVTAAITENFTHAGRRLHLSQSAVSQQIQLLEKEVGEPLFIRMNRRVKLTRAGEELLPAAKELLRWRAILIEKSNPQATELGGQLTVGTSAAATAYLWSSIYQAFAFEHPRIEMDIRTVPRTQDTIDHVISGDLDVGFAPMPVTTRKLEGRPLGFQEAFLTTAASHRLGTLKNVRARDLANERFILYEPQISFRNLADQFFQRERITPKVVLESNDTHLIRAMVEVDFGIAFLPNWSIQREIREGRLRVIPVPGKPLVQELGLIFRERGLPPAARAFVEFCTANRKLLPEVAQTRTHPRKSLTRFSSGTAWTTSN